MRSIDRKTQMMDAGFAYFETGEGFGMAIGSVKACLGKFGKVYSVGEDGGGAFGDEVQPGELPRSTGPADFFMDFSTPWRSRYISCKVEAAGPVTELDAANSTENAAAKGADIPNGNASDCHSTDTATGTPGNAPAKNDGEPNGNESDSLPMNTAIGRPGNALTNATTGDRRDTIAKATERYAARLKEGNRSTPLRLWTMVALAVAALAVGSFALRGWLWTVVGLAAALWPLWELIAPSKTAQRTLWSIKHGIEEGRKA